MSQLQSPGLNAEFSDFEQDVYKGLSSSPKHIPSRYFYDEKGDQLFQQIMELDEYYLTRAEHEIFETYKRYISEHLKAGGAEFQLAELGAGDGVKTKVLLRELQKNGARFKYVPIDISQHALDELLADLQESFPDLRGEGICDDYFGALERLNKGTTRKVVLFLGSNIGNFIPNVAAEFLVKMRENMNNEDRLLIGIDLKKDPKIIRKAYDDSQGVTREFNLNLLDRINRELDGDFNRDNFEHAPVYIPETGAARSFIRSKTDQVVYIGKLNSKFSFNEGERIYTEISQKYSVREIEEMAEKSGFEVVTHYFDNKKYFVDTLWKPK